jgi:hypothetical protein
LDTEQLALGGSAGAGAEQGGGRGGGGGVATAVACQAEGWILDGVVLNARDMGGVAIEGGGQVVCGRLYRGSKLSTLTEAGCAAVGELGLATVVDLRTASEVAAAPNAACVSEHSRLILAPMPTPYSLSAADYLADLHATESVAAAFEALADAANYPLYLHCVYGRDRTGVLAGVILLALGASRDAVMNDYLRSIDGGVGATPASFTAVLDEIESQGGIDAYLAMVGVSETRMTRIRSLLVQLPEG